MQNVSQQLYQIVSANQRDLAPVDCYEFYAPDVVDLIPGNAERRFSSTALVWYGWEYQQQAISRGDVSRYMTEKFNSVNITLSNVDRLLSDWLSTINLEGYRVLIRAVSRSISNDSITLFVGRCEKPGDIENAQISLTAKQDLGSIENEIPFAKFDPRCPLKFKGTECLAGESESAKSVNYTSANACNKSFQQCAQYGNQKAFQGFRYRAVIGSFKVNARSTGASASPIGSRRATKMWTSTDNAATGQSVPMGLGRSQIDLTPVLYADTGEYLYGHFIAGEGPVTEFANVRNTTAGWATTFQSKTEHVGEFGPETSQKTTSALLGDEYYSHRAYVEATIEGDNPDTGDPAPTIAAVVLWNKIQSLGGACFDNLDFSDNPVEHVRHLLTSERGLKYPESWIDDETAAETARFCNEPLLDTSGCEEFYYDQNQGTAGTDWKRYRSTGILDWQFFRYLLYADARTPSGSKPSTEPQRPQTFGALYQAYDPEHPPDPSGIRPTTFYRKRYTSNWHLKEPVKVADFLFKHLLPSFRGYLTTGADGKLQIKSERPAISSYLRNSTSVGATEIAVEDVTVWQRLALNRVYALVGAGTVNSETRRVVDMEYSTAGNYLTIDTSVNNIQNVTAYSGTFTGGSATTRAWNYLTVGSSNIAIIVNIDGTIVTASSNTGTAAEKAGELATIINANPTLSRYIEAVWTPADPTKVTLFAKLGKLILESGMQYPHTTAERAVHVHAAFADAAFGMLSKSNIIKDSFKWPMGSKQSSYNQFALTYTDAVQDFQQVELRENDYDHQDRVNKVNKLDISGACVDNYHQADRLVQAARYKYRDGDFFCSFQSAGPALLLEEGDIIAVNHANMIGRRNQLFRVEELRVTQNHTVSIVARLYAEEQFTTAATVRTMGLNAGSTWFTTAPPAVTNLAIEYTTIDSGRVSFTFSPDYLGSQTAKIEINRGSGYVPLAEIAPIVVAGAKIGIFEASAIVPNTQIRITPINARGTGTNTTTLTVTTPPYRWPVTSPSAAGQVLITDANGNLSWGTVTASGNSLPSYAWFLS